MQRLIFSLLLIVTIVAVATSTCFFATVMSGSGQTSLTHTIAGSNTFSYGAPDPRGGCCNWRSN